MSELTLCTRMTKAEDLAQANAWRSARGVPELPAEMLPATGMTCMKGESPIAMCWLYLSNSKLAYLAWPVTRPGLSPRTSHQALGLIFVELIGLAHALGFKSIISTSESKGLTKLLKRHGMLATGTAHAILSMEVG